MSIKKAILEKNDGNEVEKAEYVNLILDDMNIGDICEEDKAFLEGFTESQFLSLNNTQLKSLQNLPKLPKLERLELNDNKIGAYSDTLLHLLSGLYENLRVLKLSNNQIKSLEELQPLTQCTKLESLDLSNNPIIEKLGTEYSQKVRELLPKIEILDGFNKEGVEVVSEGESDEDEEEDDDDEEEEEEGEDEEDDEADEEVAADGQEEGGDEDDDQEGDEEGDQEGEGADEEEAVEGVGKKRKMSEKQATEGEQEALEGSGKDATKKRVNVDPSN